MALIKCPECGKEISSEADACIHCGFPIKKKQKRRLSTTERKGGCDLKFFLAKLWEDQHSSRIVL